MRQDEYNGLQVGDCVRVRRSGKLYVARWVHTAEERRAAAERANAELAAPRITGRTMLTDDEPDVTFLQWRDGREYGAMRSLKPEAIDRAEDAETVAQVRRILGLLEQGIEEMRADVPRVQGRVARGESEGRWLTDLTNRILDVGQRAAHMRARLEVLEADAVDVATGQGRR